jgi:hypothetical protein
MKDLYSKVIVVLVGVAAFLGISASNLMASAPSTVSEITGKSALYLEHGKSMAVDMTISNGFNDHYSHSSHESHSSHRSHYSGY